MRSINFTYIKGKVPTGHAACLLTPYSHHPDRALAAFSLSDSDSLSAHDTNDTREGT